MFRLMLLINLVKLIESVVTRDVRHADCRVDLTRRKNQAKTLSLCDAMLLKLSIAHCGNLCIIHDFKYIFI